MGKLWFQLLHTKAWPVHTRETRVHRALQADRNCKCMCVCALICVTAQGNSLRVKSGLMTINGSCAIYVNARPLTPNTMHSVGLPPLKIKYSLNQPPQTNGCSGTYGDAQSKEYQINDLLQKYPCVLASWCAQSCTLTDTRGKILKGKQLHRLQTG